MRLSILIAGLALALPQHALAEHFSIFANDSGTAIPQIDLAIDRDSISHHGDLLVYRIRWYETYNNRMETQSIVADCAARRRGKREGNEEPESVTLYSVYPKTLLAIELDIACGLKPSPDLAPGPRVSDRARGHGVSKGVWTPMEIDALYRTASHGSALAFDDLKRAAESGIAQAQIDLGQLYGTGQGVPFDDVESMKWYAMAVPDLRRRATAGESYAQFALGTLYLTGVGVTADKEEALSWLRKAADQGNKIAKRMVAQRFMAGDGAGLRTREQLHADALALAREAAEGGDAESQYYLASLYESGAAGVKNPEAALDWYRKSASQGDAQAQYKVGMAYLKGDWGMTQDYVLAAKWLRPSAAQGDLKAAYEVGELYFNGQGVEQDDAEAAQWLRRAAERGFNRQAQARLAQMYRSGRGVPQNDAEADKWQARSAQVVQAVTSQTPPGAAKQLDGVTGPVASIDVHGCAPVYPPAAQQAKEAGTVRLYFSVAADDSLMSARVIASSGYADLDQAALAALSRCKFKAATSKEGKPVQSAISYDYAWPPG